MKKRNSTIIVDLAVIKSNIKVLQSYLGDRVQSMAVVKADAYGHGAVKIAETISGYVDWFAVNDVDEGIELRESGIKNSILVFGVPEKSIANKYKFYTLTATISAIEQFELLPDGTRYHLNFDTGMGRLGFRTGQIEQVRQQVANHPELHCTGIYSHFATADQPDSAKPDQQYQAFNEILPAFSEDLLVHMCNTAGIVQYPDVHFDMVRFGIGMYGYPPGQVTVPTLKPAINWQTRLVQVNTIREGETVSYGARWRAEKDSFIGIIPVGYSDGIPRNLSGKFGVQIKGEHYPVVGTVTMNYCVIWLGMEKVSAGTPVELLNERCSAKGWANKINTIPYEVLTGISIDIPRRYS